MFRSAALLSFASVTLAQTYSATYTPDDTPKQSEKGQTGTNQCGSRSNQSSMCQNVYINSLEDFCIFGPPEPGPGSVVGNTERIEIAWCVQAGHGTRLIPDGTISGAHFVQTPDYVQVTGVGDLTKINIPAGDEGGELDPHGADGNGNPIGGLVFSNAFGGSYHQMHEWTNFISANEFCIRACKDGPKAPAMCEHIYDVMGCFWNMPGDYSTGSFDSCQGDSGEPMGVYGTSTFHQGSRRRLTHTPHPPSPNARRRTRTGSSSRVSSTASGPNALTSAASSTASATSGRSQGTSSTSGTSTVRPSCMVPSIKEHGLTGRLQKAPSAPSSSTSSASTTSAAGNHSNGAVAFGAARELAFAGAAVVVGAALLA
ncbi:uncharacterized protein BXZ73DRAFT_88277 [Epithele typhae]|uniref:uncharacterized protein n=1 Tax=Epithele typhae TaxID=378194 RepID=UPI002007DCFD|nr:uncharacterized protein BXZ73DRAFT_88277 [Epithele typhae]KAH9941893.1 hypothetical protein BXZ73DRAFT_88277 [Epithele typhae]